MPLLVCDRNCCTARRRGCGATRRIRDRPRSSAKSRRKRRTALTARNRTKSTVRSKVEHVFGVIKLKFGFTKVRYRGLAKNANRLFVTAALVNLFIARHRLMRA